MYHTQNIASPKINDAIAVSQGTIELKKIHECLSILKSNATCADAQLAKLKDKMRNVPHSSNAEGDNIVITTYIHILMNLLESDDSSDMPA